MLPVAMLMIHNPAMMAVGDHNDMAMAIEMLGEVKENIINAYATEEVNALVDYGQYSRHENKQIYYR